MIPDRAILGPTVVKFLLPGASVLRVDGKSA